MKKQHKIIILVGIGLTLLAIFLGFFTSSAYGLVGVFGGIFLINLASDLDKKVKWNHGVSEKTGEPWEFQDVIDYSDGSWDLFFKSMSDTKIDNLWIKPHDYLKKEYKGLNNF